MDNLVERLQAWGDLDTEHGHNSRADTLHRAAAKITALEASLAEAEGRVIAEMVAWLRESATKDPVWAAGRDEQVYTDALTSAADDLASGEWRK